MKQHTVTARHATVASIAVVLCMAPAAHAAVTISSAATSNMNCTGGVCSPTAKNAVLNVGDLTTMLASGSVSVNTGTGSLPAQVEDIIVAATFNWASANALTLDAYRSVTVTAPIAVNGVAPVSLVTNDGGSGGYLMFISGGSLSFLGTANNLSINRQTYTLATTIATLASDIAGNPSGYYALSGNYDAKPDGTYTAPPIPTTFTGTFNGLGNAIENLTIDGGFESQSIGLLAYVDTLGAIDSLRVTHANVSGKHKQRGQTYSGIIAGISNGTVFNSFASGKMAGKAGIKEYFNGGVTVGGIVGLNRGEVLDSAADATIVEIGGSDSMLIAGGLVGGNSGSIEISYATGSISLVGQPSVVESGGLLGWFDSGGAVENCYASGTVTADYNAYAGGLVGQTDMLIAESYSTGEAKSGSDSWVGGLVGDDTSNGDQSNDYWDTTTSGITNLSQGAGNPANDPGITGETTKQLKSGLPTGFDPTIWAESKKINNGFPYLINNPPQ